MDRCEQVEFNETQVVVDQLERNGVDFIEGDAAFENEHTLAVRDTERSFEIVAKFIIVATGTTPSRPPPVPFEDGVIVDSNGLTTLKQLPKSIIVVGTGVIRTGSASMLALLRIQVTLIDQRPVLLDFVDQEVTESSPIICATSEWFFILGKKSWRLKRFRMGRSARLSRVANEFSAMPCLRCGPTRLHRQHRTGNNRHKNRRPRSHSSQ